MRNIILPNFVHTNLERGNIMDYDEMSDEEFYNLSPEEHEKYLIKSYQNTRKIEILEK